MGIRRRTATFVIDPNTPKSQRVYVSEGHKLIDEPSRKQVWYSIVVGRLIRRSGKRLKRPARADSRRFWTTTKADAWWHNEINRLEGVE